MTDAATLDTPVLRGAGAIEMIDLDRIDFHLGNHRHDALRDPAKLDALAASMRTHGLLQPILVLEAADRFRMVYGHRRLEAARLLGWTRIGAQVREAMSDRQVLLERAIENLHRQDLNPMEQIIAVEQAWLATDRDHRQTARELGVTDNFVLDRLFIGRGLCPAAHDIALTGVLGIGHLRELIKIRDHEDQAEVIERLTRPRDHDSKELQRPRIEDVRAQVRYCVTDLAKAAWQLDVPFAGKPACDGCPANTSSDPGLFGDLRGHCADYACFQAKADAVNQAAQVVARHLVKCRGKSITAEQLATGIPGNPKGVEIHQVDAKILAGKIRHEMKFQAPSRNTAKKKLTAEQQAIKRYRDAGKKWVRSAIKAIGDAAQSDAMIYALLLMLFRTRSWHSLSRSKFGDAAEHGYGKPLRPRPDRPLTPAIRKAIDLLGADEVDAQVKAIVDLAAMPRTDSAAAISPWNCNMTATHRLAQVMGAGVEAPPHWRDYAPAPGSEKRPRKKTRAHRPGKKTPACTTSEKGVVVRSPKKTRHVKKKRNQTQSSAGDG